LPDIPRRGKTAFSQPSREEETVAYFTKPLEKEQEPCLLEEIRKNKNQPGEANTRLANTSASICN
jgi:hypothetical protein